jgi:hypothetical protein
MDIEQLIREGFKRLAADGAAQVRVAKVVSVDKARVVCEVEMVDTEAGLGGVRLRATDDEADEGLVVYPKPGSFVLVTQIANDGGWLVLMGSEYEALSIKRNGKDLGKTLIDFAKALQTLTVTTPAGESKPPTNLSDFVQVEQDLKTVFGL